MLPFPTRCIQSLYRNVLAWLGCSVPSLYLRHDRQLCTDLGIGYLIIEYISEREGKMLSCTWSEKRTEEKLRSNLFRDLCRILVDIARVPLPRIGSFIVNDDGFLSLENRPLTLEIHELENENIPVAIPRHLTYSTVDSYVADILILHDLRLRHQPNAISNVQDCLYQMSALTMMRALSPLFLRRDLRNGPFVFALTDAHPSNIFVDKNWHIARITDLEWACSRPIELLCPPRWLTNQPVDMMDAAEYDTVRREYMGILREVEQEVYGAGDQNGQLSLVMNEGWNKGTFWYALALKSLTGLCRLFYDHIQPRLAPGHEDDPAFYSIVTHYWVRDRKTFIAEKVREKEDYDARLQKAFES